MSYEGERFFFVHIMKTAGGTFAHYLRQNLPPGTVYPKPGVDEDLVAATYRIDYVLGLSERRRRSIAAYTGHFPSIVADLLDEDLTRITILREPVERTISYLRHCRVHHPQHRELSLEQIYEDDFYNPGFIQDHQTKQFSFTERDPLTTYFERLDVDERRLDLARENLARMDVIGLAEDLPSMIDEVRRRWGWGPLKKADVHVGTDDSEVPDHLRERIAEDNAIDVAFYEHACDLVAARRAEPVR